MIHPVPAAARKPIPVPTHARAPMAKSLSQEQSDFTSEGSPPPREAVVSIPAGAPRP